MRIIEASIAIIIIMSVLFVIYTRDKIESKPDLSEKARDILEEISRNSSLRNAILKENKGVIENFVSSKIPENYLAYEVRICEVDNVCGKSNYTSVNIYVGERVISSNLTSFQPKKVKIFIWEE